MRVKEVNVQKHYGDALLKGPQGREAGLHHGRTENDVQENGDDDDEECELIDEHKKVRGLVERV